MTTDEIAKQYSSQPNEKEMSEEERKQIWGHLKGKPWSEARRNKHNLKRK